MSEQEAKNHCCSHSADGTATDPVCGMKVDPALTQHHAEAEGVEYFFCSVGCQTKFVADPHRYLHSDGSPPTVDPAAVAEGAIWTCPMHPEIRQDAPGSGACNTAISPPNINPQTRPTLR